MKRNMKKVLTVLAASIIMCMNLSVFATSVPQKTEATGSQNKYANDTQKIIDTAKDNETKNDGEQTKTSPKASEKTQATAKTTQSPKASAKATKTPESTSKSTVSTIKPENTADNKDENNEENGEENVIVVDENEPEPTLNVIKNPEQINANRYLTKGGAFGMFLLTVLVSAIISFLISYRFYKMHRSDSHLAAEIRALKRDIDVKMAASVGGFSEYETKTENLNPSYARNGHPIRIERSEEAPKESDDVLYSKWETQINSSEEKTKPNEERAEIGSRSERYQRARKQKSKTNKIKDAFGEMFSKKK